MIGLASLPQWISENPQWDVAGAIVLLGLFVYGLRDLLLFSWTRIWAIGGVCFAESMRRRVLLIVPLAILGVIIVAQLQHPIDEQDAIRESTKFCLFATGLVVTLTIIILACTNLPKEIDNRVIYTVVTKPATRLEIVLGKIVGFSRVSATILVIMGVFTVGYVQFRAWVLGSAIDQRLADSSTDKATAATLQHYKDSGLLNARTYALANGLQIVSREPHPEDHVRWMFGGEGNCIIPFHIDEQDLIPKNDASQTPGSAGLAIVARIGFEPSEFGPPVHKPAKPVSAIPDTISAPTPAHAGSQPADAEPPPTPTVSFQILDQNLNTLLDPRAINGGNALPLTDPQGRSSVVAGIPASVDLQNLYKSGKIYLEILCNTPKIEYFVDREPAVLAVPLLNPDAKGQPILNNDATKIEPITDPANAPHPTPPMMRSTQGLYGLQVRGGATGKIPVAVYQFRDVHPTADTAGKIPFEMRVGIEHSGGGTEAEQPTIVKPTVIEHTADGDKRFDDLGIVSPELNRTSFFSVPAEAVASGNFDVQLRCLSNEQSIGISDTSLHLVISEHSFEFNLFKSLSILWLMSVLVIIISIFCSTFLSWPIAIVLTVLILLGHWGVDQLGDSTAPGIGNLVATDMGLRDPSKMHVVSDSVEALAKMLNILSNVLPDITKFSALEDIERGVSLPISRLTDSLTVIGMFGVPLMVMSYIFLRNKEVAP
jgi:ABC-type transport system involved in multi-copper enzyme maturation permease subunit